MSPPAPAGRVAGSVSLATFEGEDFWVVECEPHISLKLKQVFQRIYKGQFGHIRIKATPEASRDLEWFMMRYPLEVNGDLEELQRRARLYDERLERTAEILARRRRRSSAPSRSSPTASPG